jgi:hypothetical protein
MSGFGVAVKVPKCSQKYVEYNVEDAEPKPVRSHMNFAMYENLAKGKGHMESRSDQNCINLHAEKIWTNFQHACTCIM